jgi:hypothetical protein
MESRDQGFTGRLTHVFMSASGRLVRVTRNGECSHKSGGNHASIRKMQPGEQF